MKGAHMHNTNCVARHSKPRQATHGKLCTHHHRQLNELLTEIAETYSYLTYFYEIGTGTDDGKQVHGKRIDPPAPVRLDILSILDRRTTAIHPGDPVPVARILEDWATLVREQRNLTRSNPHTLAEDVATLTTNVDWSTQQEWVTDLLTELITVRNALNNAIGDNPPKPVGSCPITTDTQTCNGKLFQDRNNGLNVICNKCGETWGETELRRLGLIIGYTN